LTRHRRINGLIELHRRIARGFRNRDNYRLCESGEWLVRDWLAG
jgi:hypothetical protein